MKINKKGLLKLIDVTTIIISFLLVLYSRKNMVVGSIALLVLYTSFRNFFKEFIYPLEE